jgi:ABC-type phosphate transport system substrate-binding protein
MQEAAMRVFGQMFQEVEVGPTMSAPTITLQLNGSSSLNPAMNEYFANATVTVFAGWNTDVQPIASFAGTGQAGQADFGRGGIEQAYEGAFRQVAEFLLVDPHLIAGLQGY